MWMCRRTWTCGWCSGSGVRVCSVGWCGCRAAAESVSFAANPKRRPANSTAAIPSGAFTYTVDSVGRTSAPVTRARTRSARAARPKTGPGTPPRSTTVTRTPVTPNRRVGWTVTNIAADLGRCRRLMIYETHQIRIIRPLYLSLNTSITRSDLHCYCRRVLQEVRGLIEKYRDCDKINRLEYYVSAKCISHGLD